MNAHGVLRNPLEYNMKFINSLRKGRGNVKFYLQSNGSQKKLKLYQLFDELQGHESNVSQTLRQLSGGPISLVSTVNPLLPNLAVSNPFKVAAHAQSVSPVQPILPVLKFPYEENFDPEAADVELPFQQQFDLLSRKYMRPCNNNQKPPPNRFQYPHQNIRIYYNLVMIIHADLTSPKL